MKVYQKYDAIMTSIQGQNDKVDKLTDKVGKLEGPLSDALANWWLLKNVCDACQGPCGKFASPALCAELASVLSIVTRDMR